jgi:rfaE bifunctional protein nucleotidyltransferase chain/domain
MKWIVDKNNHISYWRYCVWVNGVFDILHIGHIKLFEFAKSQGNYLKVGIDSDERVKLLKGLDRPYNNQNIRKEILKSIKYIDEVIIFNSDEELTNLIKNYDPDIFVISSEYNDKKIIGKEYLRKIIYFDRILEYSSTKYIDLLKEQKET